MDAIAAHKGKRMTQGAKAREMSRAQIKREHEIAENQKNALVAGLQTLNKGAVERTGSAFAAFAKKIEGAATTEGE